MTVMVKEYILVRYTPAPATAQKKAGAQKASSVPVEA
jgi:hypothetical protein